MERIVSLIPAGSEIVCGLGLLSHSVGRSHECDFPQGIEELPVVTKAKLNPLRGSKEIHTDVKSMLAQALSLYEVDVERLRELNPTVIVTQDQCNVCAVSQNDVEVALESWLGQRPKVVSLTGSTVDGIFADILRVGDASGVADKARQLIQQLRDRMSDVATSSADVRPRVATIEWMDPLMSGGHWMPELITMAGGENLFGEHGQRSPWIKMSELVSANPDVLVVMPCGFGIEQTRSDMTALSSQPGWDDLRAVKNGRVYIADGHQFFNRPGPRIVESLEILLEMIDPSVSFGHRGVGWVTTG